MKKVSQKQKILSASSSKKGSDGEKFGAAVVEVVDKIMHPRLTESVNIDLNTNPRKLFAFKVVF